jgi:hypothetical protein
MLSEVPPEQRTENDVKQQLALPVAWNIGNGQKSMILP